MVRQGTTWNHYASNGSCIVREKRMEFIMRLISYEVRDKSNMEMALNRTRHANLLRISINDSDV